MAIHRKQRSIVDGTPQFVRLPALPSGEQVMRFSLQKTHLRPQPLYKMRYAASDRSHKISSLQLRGCFVLCVLLYFSAIYFADDVASIGRVVGSEQSSQNFFVHTLRPRGRGAMRAGRADSEKSGSSTAPGLTTAALKSAEPNSIEQYTPMTEVSKDELRMDEAKGVAAYSKAQVTKAVLRPEAEPEVKRQKAHTVTSNASRDAMDKDDSGQDVHIEERVHLVESNSSEPMNALPAKISKPNDRLHETSNRDPVVSTVSRKHDIAESEQSHLTMVASQPDRGVNTNIMHTASSSHVKQNQNIRLSTDSEVEHQVRKAKQIRQPVQEFAEPINNKTDDNAQAK